MPLHIYGARGTRPVSGLPYLKYSGHTSCFSLSLPEGLLIIDAGTGLGLLGEQLQAQASLPPITLLLTHLHLDHVTGLGGFQPLTRADAVMTLMTDPRYIPNWQSGITQLMSRPFWPFELGTGGARLKLRDLDGPPGHPLRIYGATVTWCPVQHPQGCLSYRIETGSGSVVIATDRECGDTALDAAFLTFCRGANLLIHDAQYTPQEYAQRRGWGHSTWEHAARVATEAGVGRLLLTSHDPTRSDDAIDAMLAQARRLFPKTDAATVGAVTL